MNKERTSQRERKATQNHQVETLGRETAGTQEGAEAEERGGSMTVGPEGRPEHSRVRKGRSKGAASVPETQGRKDRENSWKTNSSSLLKFGESHKPTTSRNPAPVLRNTKQRKITPRHITDKLLKIETKVFRAASREP